MKLKEFTVREFKSIWDSGPIKVDDQITCLVGKNEAGKTALLTALYRTNPIIPEDNCFDPTYDYPKREVEEYRFSIENKERDEAVVVDCLYELDAEDKAAVAKIFGTEVLKSDIFRRTTYYGKSNSQFVLSVDDLAALKHLASNPDFPDCLQDSLEATGDWEAFAQVLDEAEANDAVNTCKKVVAKVVKHGLAYHIFNSLLWPRAPKYLYFDEYYQMKGRDNLEVLIQREDNQQLEESDRPLIGLINLARLDLRELVQTQNTTELKNKLEGAGNYLTRRIAKYWSQNKHIQMKFDVREAKQQDPEGMRTGINVWGEVYDSVHWAHTPLGSRSRGFIWFFSFLAWYEDVKRQNQNVILLLDEPGLSLHGRAQGDLLNYFDEELARHQLIYSTHSPFMIDPRKFERIRIVQDLGIDSNTQLPKARDGTKVLTNIFDATNDSLFPLQGALGYDIHQTLFIGPDSLVIEGLSDMLYLRAASGQLEREGRTGLSEKWTLTPVGGSGKVPTFVALLAPQHGMNVATLLDVQASDRAVISDLYKKRLLKKINVLTYAEFVDPDEADIEDLFDREFYVSLVNKEFKKEIKKPIETGLLNGNIPRTLKALEAFIADNPFKSGHFGHYRPARYFVENIDALWPRVSDETKKRFEMLFERANALLKRRR